MGLENLDKDAFYFRQVKKIFERSTQKPLWEWQPQYQKGLFDATPNTVFDFLERLLLNLKTDLAPYNADQIAGGINYIFNNSQSDFTHDFKNANVTYERKKRALESLFYLWRDIFNPFCAPETSAYSQSTISELNGVCYMFWDVSSFSNWHGYKIKDSLISSYLNSPTEEEINGIGLNSSLIEILQQNKLQLKAQLKTEEDILSEFRVIMENMKVENFGYNNAVANIMKQSLYLSNPACIESGLHGLGHMAFSNSKLAVPIIDEFLKNPKTSNKNLIFYAQQARTGMIL